MSQEAWIELSDLKEKEAINQSTNQPMEKGRKREGKGKERNRPHETEMIIWGQIRNPSKMWR